MANISNQKKYELNIGEKEVHDRLKDGLKENNCHILSNITLPTLDGSTQIDHIVIAPSGIFVIEVKHLSGWIFGSEKNATWTQRFSNSQTFLFQNPIRQNYKHIKTLQNLLKTIDHNNYHSKIILTGDAEFKNEKPKELTEIQHLIEEIKFRKTTLKEEEIFQAIGKIEHTRFSITEETDIEHINHLNEKFKNSNQKRSSINLKNKRINNNVIKIIPIIGVTCVAIILIIQIPSIIKGSVAPSYQKAEPIKITTNNNNQTRMNGYKKGHYIAVKEIPANKSKHIKRTNINEKTYALDECIKRIVEYSSHSNKYCKAVNVKQIYR